LQLGDLPAEDFQLRLLAAEGFGDLFHVYLPIVTHSKPRPGAGQ
jgi:hypothetical protein